ncbi:MAG: Hsp20/alpha crystallin family protein [Bacteroidia bacterium]|nr:Hsp20/alpha crystallin family protein [Bacteroidia bacterium]
MSLVRYNAGEYTPTSFSSLIDRFFNDSLVRAGGSSFVPKVDVVEDEKSFAIQVAVPGMSKEDFKIDLNDNHLTISGERKFKTEKKEKNFHSIETQYGSFSRSFALPENVDTQNIAAKYEKGILEIVVPKDEKEGAEDLH